MPNLYPGILPPYRSGQRLLCLCAVFLLPLLVFAQPSISTVSPLSGPVGTTVTITGTNFSATPSANIVRFGSVTAPVVSAGATSLTVTVPNGASYQPITVTTGGLTAYYYNPFSTTFLDPGQFTASSFAAAANTPTDLSPMSVVCMDFDGDGKSDLAVANGMYSVSVFRNASTVGAPVFVQQYDSTQPGGFFPNYVAAGDLDGDGKPDLVMANSWSNYLGVFQNTSTAGHISMNELPQLPEGSGANWVTVGDCNGDGKPEIACVNMGDNTVTLYTNTSTIGNISFGVQDTLLLASLPNPDLPWSATIADVDGDGMPDIVVADWNNSLVSVFRNTGTRGGPLSFGANQTFVVGTNPEGIAVGDLDGDGLPEIITANNTDNTVTILHNTSTSGNISLVRGTDQPTGNSPTAVSVTDLDGDGRPDIAASLYGDNGVSVLRNTTTSGTISMATHVDYATGDAPMDIHI
ncbi:MAG TPA: VCBS repeat-containing protein, partial [Puia sp.]|nr:VCBS repeat-containing protein [Puia sp.]